jgi:sugar/nucleoside kinase (ribokinase family)
MMGTRIAVIGSTTIDEIIDRNRAWLRAGGVPLYSGITYSRQGFETVAITNIADGDARLIQRFQEQNIQVYTGETPHTTRFINDIRSDERRQQNPQRAAPISHKLLSDHLDDVDIVHLGPLHPDDIDIQAIRALKALDMEIILDIQGLVRKVKQRYVFLEASARLSDALRSAHIVKANKREYAVVLEYFQTDPVTLMRQFNIREFIVTAGANGGFVQQVDAAPIPYAAPALKSRGDSTGAGDIFLAGYVVRRLLRQDSIPKACQSAAGLVTRHIAGNYIKEADLRI